MSDDGKQTMSADIYTPVTITIDVNAMLRQQGWAGVDQTGEEDWEPVGKLAEVVAQAIARQLAPQLKKDVSEAVKESAKTKVDAIIDEVINGEIQLTNSYGERTGGTLTLREQIVKSIKEELSRKVDNQGRTPSYNRDGVSYVRYVADSAAKQAINNELKDAIAEAIVEVKARVKAVVAEELGAKIATAVTRA